jgi:hypothetical protein
MLCTAYLHTFTASHAFTTSGPKHAGVVQPACLDYLPGALPYSIQHGSMLAKKLKKAYAVRTIVQGKRQG